GKFFAQFHTKTPVRLANCDGVLKIVGEAVTFVTEVEPRLRILVYKQRSERADVAKAVVLERRALPGSPGVGAQRVFQRTQAQQVHHHQLAVGLPPIREEATFGSPAMGEEACILCNPGPLDTIEDVVCEASDLGMRLKILAAGEDAAEENGGIDRRNLGFPHAFTGADIREMEEESPVGWQFAPQRAQSREHTGAGVSQADVSAFVPDAEGGQTEAGRGNAGYRGVIRAGDLTAIFDESSLIARLLEEVKKICFLQFFEKSIVSIGQLGRCG